jgi:hypothetical protein
MQKRELCDQEGVCDQIPRHRKAPQGAAHPEKHRHNHRADAKGEKRVTRNAIGDSRSPACLKAVRADRDMAQLKHPFRRPRIGNAAEEGQGAKNILTSATSIRGHWQIRSGSGVDVRTPKRHSKSGAVGTWQTATLETEICGQRLSTARAANEPQRRWNGLGRPTAATASRGNVVLFCGLGNHVDLRGLPGGAEGIRTSDLRSAGTRARRWIPP